MKKLGRGRPGGRWLIETACGPVTLIKQGRTVGTGALSTLGGVIFIEKGGVGLEGAKRKSGSREAVQPRPLWGRKIVDQV